MDWLLSFSVFYFTGTAKQLLNDYYCLPDVLWSLTDEFYTVISMSVLYIFLFVMPLTASTTIEPSPRIGRG